MRSSFEDLVEVIFFMWKRILNPSDGLIYKTFYFEIGRIFRRRHLFCLLLPPFLNICLSKDFNMWLHRKKNEWIYTLKYIYIHSYVIVHLKSLKRQIFRNGGSSLHECKKSWSMCAACISSVDDCYSLHSKLLAAEMDVSRTKMHIYTSIRATSNSEWREY